MTNLDIVLAKCDHLVETGLWPREQDFPFRRWLANFESHQQPVAAKLLDRLVFVNEEMAHGALLSACQRLLSSFASGGPIDPLPSTEAISSVHDSIIITPIRGERPSPTDSAYSYARAARDRLGVHSDRIVDDLAMAVDRASRSDGIVVLVDDIIGSGDQITSTVADMTDCSCPLACLAAIVTSHAYERLTTEFPDLQIFAGHILDIERYGIHALLPVPEHQDAHDLLHHVAQSLRVPAYVDDPVYGFKGFGLTLAFHNSIPDFSLPILWAPGGSGWTPLKERA